MDDGGGDALIEAFREQVRWCDKLSSPFTARLLEWLANDWLAGGPLRTLLPTWSAGPPGAGIWCRCAWPARCMRTGALGPASGARRRLPAGVRPSMRKCWRRACASAGRRPEKLRHPRQRAADQQGCAAPC